MREVLIFAAFAMHSFPWWVSLRFERCFQSKQGSLSDLGRRLPPPLRSHLHHLHHHHRRPLKGGNTKNFRSRNYGSIFTPPPPLTSLPSSKLELNVARALTEILHLISDKFLTPKNILSVSRKTPVTKKSFKRSREKIGGGRNIEREREKKLKFKFVATIFFFFRWSVVYALLAAFSIQDVRSESMTFTLRSTRFRNDRNFCPVAGFWASAGPGPFDRNSRWFRRFSNLYSWHSAACLPKSPCRAWHGFQNQRESYCC